MHWYTSLRGLLNSVDANYTNILIIDINQQDSLQNHHAILAKDELCEALEMLILDILIGGSAQAQDQYIDNNGCDHTL